MFLFGGRIRSRGSCIVGVVGVKFRVVRFICMMVFVIYLGSRLFVFYFIDEESEVWRGEVYV